MSDEERVYTKEDFEKELWLSPKDIEKKLNLSHTTVTKLMKVKGFPLTRIGRNIRINAKDFKEFLDNYKNNTINL